jgi:hypothetical protein
MNLFEEHETDNASGRLQIPNRAPHVVGFAIEFGVQIRIADPEALVEQPADPRYILVNEDPGLDTGGATEDCELVY